MGIRFSCGYERRKNTHVQTIRKLSFAWLLLSIITVSYATTKTATSNGNWSSAAIWSPAGVPADTDNVVIEGGVTVTVDSIYACNDLDVGDNANTASVLKIVTSGKSLTINGDFRFNPNNKGQHYVLDAGPGTINIAGTFSYWGTAGTNTIQVSSGTLSFTPAITIASDKQYITCTGAGTVNFLSSFTDNKNRLTPYAGCTINFYNDYTVATTNADWKSKGTANFYGTGTITPTKNIALNDINIMPAANTTMATGAGTYTIKGNLAMGASCILTANKDFELDGYFSNNGGTFASGAITITMDGAVAAINSSSDMTFPSLQIGKANGRNDVNISVSCNLTVSDLVMSKANHNRYLTLGFGSSLTVTGDVTLNQSGKNNFVSTISVGNNTLTVNGDLIFSGNNNGTTRVCKVDITGGTFSLDGNISWMSNNAVATEVISVASGTINFASSISMPSKSGTLKVTSAGTINFNGTSAPSFSVGGATAPVFSTAYGSTVRFENGFSSTGNIVFAWGSTQEFINSATVTPSPGLIFGNLVIDNGATLTAGGSFSVRGNWTNEGTFAPGSYTVSFVGSSTQTISHTGGETFYGFTVTTYGNIVRLMNDVLITSSLTMNGSNIDLNGYTLTLGDNAGASISRSYGQVYGGIFKRWWPATAITATSGSYYGLFPIGTSTQYRPITIKSTSNPTTAGYVSVTHSDAVTVTNVTYTDNEGSNIELIADMYSEITTSGVAGGTYTLDVKYTNMGSTGSISNLKLLTHTGGVMGSYGTHITTSGPIDAPTGHRSGLSVSNLNNAWVIGTNDRYSTPLYRYVYSRKTGDWSDVTPGDGTWSYTAGGAGASCDCLPTSSGYAVIESGHTVSVTANDSVKFIDIMAGGTLSVKNPRTLVVGANLTLYGNASFDAPGTLQVDGELTFDTLSATSVSGDVVVSGGLTLPAGASYEQTGGNLELNGDLNVNGDLTIDGGVSFELNGLGTVIKGSGNIMTASGGSITVTNNKTIDPGTQLTFGSTSVNTTLAIGAEAFINNIGEVTLYGDITGGNSNTMWLNNATSVFNVSGTVFATGNLEASTSPNTVNYNGSGAQTIKTPYSTYYNLTVSNSGNKSISGDIQVDSVLVITGSVVLDEGTNKIWGDGGLSMSGTSELKIQRSTADWVYPELEGTYYLPAGTVTLNQTGDSAVLHGADYYNLQLVGTTPYDISSISTINNNLTVSNSASITSNSVLQIGGTFTHSTSGISTLTDSIAVNNLVLSGGTLRDGTADYYGGQSINITGADGWNVNGGSFIASDGTVYFTGFDDQSLSGSASSQSFNSLHLNKSGGTLTIGGSTTTLNLTGDMTLTGGTLDAGTATAINMSGGNWQNDGGTFVPGNSTVTFNAAADQAIQGSAASQTFNHITVNNSGNTLTVGGSTTSLTLNGNMTLSSGSAFDNGTATNITMTAGSWTNNGGTFAPASGTLTFTGSGDQEITGTVASQTLHNLTVSKSSGALAVNGSTTSLTINQDVTLNSGTFDHGTAATIYAGGNWTNNGGDFAYGSGTVSFNGSGSQAINGSASGQSFYNVTLEKSAGTLTLSGTRDTVYVNGALRLTTGTLDGGDAVIQMNSGDWTNNGGTFTPATSLVNFTGTGTAQYINGTASEQSFYDLTINKASKVLSVDGSTATLNVNQNLNIASGTFDQGVADNLNVGGNWINDGTFTQGSGSVNFIGSAAQAISGTTTTTFNNLGLDNSAEGLTLNTSANVDGALTLTNGLLHTSSSHLLTLNASASSSSGSATSYVNGPMKKIGNASFNFPIGKNGKWRRAGVSGMSNATTEITAEYFGTPYNNLSAIDTTGLDAVSDNEYWLIDRTVTADPVKIKLYWEDASVSSIENCDYLTIAHYTGGQWQREDATTTVGSVCSGTGNGSIEMDGSVTSFSPFTFGSFDGGGALPVKLLRFDAVAKDKTVETSWATAVEINNDYFTVERSSDATHFSEVGRIEGAGNSTVEQRYTFTDEHPLSGVSYYRLKQTDYDGQYAYSNIVTIKRSEVPFTLRMYPNPASDLVNITAGNTTEAITIRIYDQVGHPVFEQTLPATTVGSDRTVSLPVSELLSSGIYLVSVSTPQTTLKEKLIVR